ncbi:putative tail fiber protein [Salmonella phage GEC_vB_MG]|nr:putative tail fiber protein [Salmonella phage GEC_vB_MG]
MADYNDKVVNAEPILPEGTGGGTFVDDGQFHTEDTTTVTLLGNGTSTTPLKATVIVDPASGNALVAGADGLSVGVSPLSDNLLVLAGGKLYVAPPQIVIPISSKAGNTLVDVTDPGEEGLFVPAGEKGDKGDKGDQGTLWLNFARNPGPADGRVGDYFINKSTLEYFQKTSATLWASLGYMGGGNVYDTSSTTPQARTNAGWVDVPVLEAPTDSGYYIRVNSAWKKLDRYDLLVTSTTGAMDVGVSQVFKVDGTASKTMSFTNLPANRAMTIVIVFAGSGASLTWPAGLSWSNGTAPVLGATRTVVTILWDGTNLTGTTSLTVA